MAERQDHDIVVYNNDTFNGEIFTITVNKVALDLTGSSIRLQVRKTRDDSPVINLSLGSGLSLTDAPNGKFRIDNQIFSVTTPDVYEYDIEITLASGEVKTYIIGCFKIIGDVSHDG